MKRKLFSFSASVITAIMLTACAAAPENKPASSAALSPTSEAVATAIPSTSNANWKLPPQYDFDEMIPLFLPRNPHCRLRRCPKSVRCAQGRTLEPV